MQQLEQMVKVLFHLSLSVWGILQSRAAGLIGIRLESKPLIAKLGISIFLPWKEQVTKKPFSSCPWGSSPRWKKIRWLEILSLQIGEGNVDENTLRKCSREAWFSVQFY